MDNQQNKEYCDPVELTDQKTGLKKVMYLCKQPLVKRAQHYRENKLHFWTDLGLVGIIAILIATLIGLWAFNAFKHQNLVDFSIDYNADQLINGQRITFEVNYKNTSDKQVLNSEAIVRFPQGLHDVTIAGTCCEDQVNAVPIGNLEPGQSGSFNVEGLVLSDLGNKERFVFVLNYENDLGQPQQEFTSREFVVENSIISMQLETPQKIIIGSRFPSTVSYQSSVDYPLDDLKLQLRYPSGYAAEGDLPISLGDFNANESGSREVVGQIGQAAPGEYAFEAVILYPFKGRDFVLGKVTKNVAVDFSKFLVQFVNPGQYKNISPGNQMTVEMLLENNESFPIQNPALRLSVQGDYLDRNFLDRSYPGQVNQNIITWDGLNTIEPGESRTITATIAARSQIFVTAENQNPQDLVLRAEASYDLGADSQVFVSSPRLSVPVNSSISPSSFGLFYTSTGDQIGVGSIPPTVDEYTAYWGIVRFNNGANRLNNVRMTATVPEGVDFTKVYNVTRGTPIRLLGDGKTIEWFISEVDPYAGIVSGAPEARIQLAITPQASQVGQILPLLTNVSFSAIDSRTGMELSATSSSITTAIFNDDVMNKVAE